MKLEFEKRGTYMGELPIDPKPFMYKDVVTRQSFQPFTIPSPTVFVPNKEKENKEKEDNMSTKENKIAASFGKIVDDWFEKQKKLLKDRVEIIRSQIISQDELKITIDKAISTLVSDLMNIVDKQFHTDDIPDYQKTNRMNALAQFGEEIIKKTDSYAFNQIQYLPRTLKLLDDIAMEQSKITVKLIEHKETIKTILETCDSYNTGCEVLQGAEIFGSHFTPNDEPCSIIWNYDDLDKFIPDKIIPESK